MKKTLLVLLALLLCFSMLFVSCSKPKDDTNNDQNNNQNDQNNNENNNKPDDGGNGGEQQKPTNLNKQTVIQSFNKLDLYSIYETVKNDEGIQGIADFDVRETEQQLSGKLTIDSGTADGLVAIKDGVITLQLVDTTDGKNEKKEAYFYITEDLGLVKFDLEDGKWVAAENDAKAGPAEQSAAPQLNYELLKDIIIPAVTEAQLAEKNGRLVLDNAYFVNFASANYELLVEQFGTPAGVTDKNSYLDMVETLLDMLGLEVSFNANDNVITAICVSLTPPEDSGASFKTMGVDVVLSENGKALKSLNAYALVPTDDIDFLNGFTVTLVNTLDGDDVTAAKIAAELNIVTYGDYTNVGAANGYYKNYTAVCSKMNVNVDVKNIGKGLDPTVSATASMGVEKVYELSEFNNSDTYETTVTANETDKAGYGSEFDAKLLITSNSAANKCTVSFELEMDGSTIAGEGTWLVSAAPAFPTLPTEITDYISGK